MLALRKPFLIAVTALAVGVVGCSNLEGEKGSAGATGATGATGADGADGTIAVPDADSDLAITLQQKDLDSDANDLDIILLVSGTDNLSADSRVRYYAYQGSSATDKVHPADWNMGNTNYSAGGVLDTRVKDADNFTLDSGSRSEEIFSTSISHFILCPGNEAGDATSCASVAISDRLAQGTLTLAGLGADTNSSIAYGNGAFQVVSDNRSSADNGTMAFTVDNDTKTEAYAGTALTADNKSAVISLSGNDVVSNVAFKGNDAYIVTTDNASGFDNMTIYKRTNGLGDFSIAKEISLADGIQSVVQLGSDGTDLFAIRDNSSNDGLVGHVFLDNGTVLTSSSASISKTDMCSHAEADKMIAVVDNGTTSTAGFDVFTLHDNGTLASTASDATVSGLADILSCSLTKASSTYILTILENGGDNITVLSSDNLTGWTQVYETATGQSNSVKISAAAPNGTADVWVALDDGTNVDLYHSDNGTSGGLALVHTISAAGLGGIAHDGSASGSAKIGIAVDNGTDAKVDVYYE
jgi:hypothetical protein